MSAKELLEKAKYTVPIIDSNMRIITDTLSLIKRINKNSLEYKSDNVEKLINFFEKAIETEAKQFQNTVSLIGSLKNQKDKTILYLRYIENKSVRETGDIVGLSKRDVSRSIANGIQELNKILIDQNLEE